MGVTGLWRLIEPAGKPVPVETLENKVLAVDISIWLHQMVKGYQDAKGAPLPNAHLIGLFQRVCKLLYFRIKPVFVFDGAFPELKKETISKRQDNKLKYNSESERIRRELSLLLSKKTAISGLLGKQISPKKSSNNPDQNDDIFKLPAMPQKEDSEPESEDDEPSSSGPVIDLHSVDVESDDFKNMPVKEKYDLLIELKDTRKMNSWGKLHELPKKSDNFSDFQMQRLLKRRKVQECLEETEKEMGDCGMSLTDLESFLNEEGIDTKIEALPTRRIAANNTTRFVLINNVKQALAEAKKKKEEGSQASTSKIQDIDDKLPSEEGNSKKDELEDDLETAIKMSLEYENDANTSVCTTKTDDSWTTYDTDYSSDSEEEDGCEPPDMSSAKAYIMQYSDLTNRAINKIVSKSNKSKTKSKKPKLNEIMEDIRKEKSVILDNVDLSSSDDDDCIQENKDTGNGGGATIDAVVELNTSTDLESQNEEYVDATQASVICLENRVQDIVTLDSSSEESPSQCKIYSPQSKNKEESDSSDCDFEDVPEIETTKNKTVVQLTLNINDAPEDDIFADVFVTKKEQDVKKQNGMTTVRTPKLDSIALDDDDEELQRAIQMSLEADVELEEINESDHNKKNQQLISKTSETIPDLLEGTNEEPIADTTRKISKTQESLNVIQSVAPATKNIPVENKTAKATKKVNHPIEPISTDRLNDMVEEIQNEEQDLIQEKGRLDRVGRNITEQMTKEAQELLRLLGIPYIVAPMEAEAQCAFLENVKLTDGTITDDSDIWLFGGQTVYKNFFNQKKHVLQFLSEKIEKSFNLNREQLILLALLVGSDYTTGLTGVGPVTALEILASFPFNKRKLLNETSKQTRYAEIITGLNEFKQWVRSGRRTDNINLKKKLRNVAVTDDFPSVRVIQAYLEPNIEKSEAKFTWGDIDITVLRDYTKTKFGWSQHKLDEIIKPVLKRMVERKTQKTVHDYFKRKANIESLDNQLSKRVKAAVQKMGPEQAIEEMITEENVIKPGSKRKVKNKSDGAKAGPSMSKQNKTDAEVLKSNILKVVSDTKEASNSSIEIVIPKTDRYQEIIPQREKDKRSLLENKMKAVELFRKTQIDKKKKVVKKKPVLPKPEAELSESSDSN